MRHRTERKHRNMKKKAAVIGYGGMGSWHVKNIQASDVVELAGIYDIDPAKQSKAQANGIKAYESREALLADDSIELVTIAIPNDVQQVNISPERNHVRIRQGLSVLLPGPYKGN